jgi:dihydrofolate reductase
MRKLQVFNLITLDGYFTGENGDISWHKTGEEFEELAKKNSTSGNTLLFGRVTYQLMAAYWSTPAGLKDDPVVARGMAASPKIVFSRKLKEAAWENTRLIKGNMLAAVRRLKRGSGKPLAVLGSGSVVAQLAQAGLVDEYQLLVVPVIIGKGRPLFEGVKKRLDLHLVSSRAFSNGNMLLTYRPVRGRC